MLSSADISEMLRRPSAPTNARVQQLSAFLEAFPSCQAARLLLLSQLQMLTASGHQELQNVFEKELARALDFMPDRHGLADAISAISARFQEQPAAVTDRTMDLLNAFLGGTVQPDADPLELATVPTDYMAAYGGEDILESASKASASEDRTSELLNMFLDSAPEEIETDAPVIPMPSAPESAVEDEPQADDHAKSLDESLFTETLAEIHIRQHRYEEALEIIKSLYLNFPEKSAYFADQIRYLEKLVRINKQKDK